MPADSFPILMRIVLRSDCTFSLVPRHSTNIIIENITALIQAVTAKYADCYVIRLSLSDSLLLFLSTESSPPIRLHTFADP